MTRSFSSEVKSELCALPFGRECCRRAELYGFLLLAGQFDKTGVRLATEHAGAAARFVRLLYLVCGVEAAVSAGGSGEGKLYTVSADGEGARVTAEFFGRDRQSITLRCDISQIENECCAAAFLRGAFLSAGSINSPEAGYHLELVTPHMKLAEDLVTLIRAYYFEPRTLMRKQNCVIYFKDSSEIEDLLTTLGAQKSVLEIMSVKVYKDIRNNTNRIVNCETANLKKTVGAAARQCEAIEKLERAGVLSRLPDELQETARLRRENPECSLLELVDKLQGKLTRSGLNHRLQKLIAEAERL